MLFFLTPLVYTVQHIVVFGAVAFIILNVFQHVYNIHLEGTMSHNFEIGLSFIFMSKNVKIFIIFS